MQIILKMQQSILVDASSLLKLNKEVNYLGIVILKNKMLDHWNIVMLLILILNIVIVSFSVWNYLD